MTQENKTKWFTMRMPPTLHELLKKEAKMQERSITEQINYILKKYFE